MTRAFLTLLLLLPSLGQAADEAGGDPVAATFKVIAGLVLVLGLVLLLYALARRGFGGFAGQRAGRIKVVETRSLGPKRALYLVEVKGQELLLGVGSERIELLSNLGPAESETFDRTLRAQMESGP